MHYKHLQLVTCTEIGNRGMYYGAITDVLNKYITPKVLKETMMYHNGNYLCAPDGSRNIAFRYPGATRGHIEVDRNFRIERFRFYEINELGPIYEPQVKEALNEFIGCKLAFFNIKRGH